MIDTRIAPPEPYRALIFDCDGTLVDTMPNHFAAWRSSLRSFGADISEEKFYELGGMPSADIIQLLNRENSYSLDINATHEDKERRYVEMLQSVVEIHAVADIARENSRRGVPIAVASGGIRSVVDRTLTSAGLRELFEVIVTADDVKRGKPSPDIFLLAAERMGVAPADCIVYEDGDLGLEGAQRAGMRAVDVRVLWR